MKITGVTIIKNAVINDYPVAEAIRSILPVVDEMIVSVDKGDDHTEDLIRSIPSTKIRIVYSTWDMSLRKGGQVYAIETNKVMQQVPTDTDWIFYIQADEVIHEKYHRVIRETAERYCHEKKVDGLLFRYLHFYGTYEYVGDSRKWYKHEVRLIKNDKSIRSYKDAQGFRREGKKIRIVPVDAEVYHYGWVKSPQQMKKKQNHINQYYHDEETTELLSNGADYFDFSEFDSLEKFTGTHPLVMQERIASKSWHVELDITQKKFSLKNRVLFWFEKKTGKRLFNFRNHRIIKLK